MKSLQKMIQGTKIWLPPTIMTSFFGHGFRKSELNYLRGEGEEERGAKRK